MPTQAQRARPWILFGFVIASCTAPPGSGVECTVNADCASAGVRCVAGTCVPDVVPGACAPAAGDPVTTATPVRVFAVGQHPTVTDAQSDDTWAAMVRRAVDSTVVPHLATDRPNVLVFPEGTGLLAATLGPRGAQARAENTTARALADLAVAYAPAVAYYTTRAGTMLPPARALSLALTDTLWRMVERAYVPIAQGLQVWVVVSLPLGSASRSTDPAVVAALADPGSADGGYAWVADDSTVHAVTWIFSPDGTLAASVPQEQPDAKDMGFLALTPGPPGGVRGVDLPFGRVGVMAGRDAWAPDVIDRLALDGPELWLAPAASPGWGGYDAQGAWLPEVFAAGARDVAVRELSVRAVASACLSANVYDQGYDGQSAVLVPGGVNRPDGGYIGDVGTQGYASVGNWVLPDDPTQTLAARRATLAARGAELLPGGTRAGQYAEGGGWYDVDLGAPPRAVPAGVQNSAAASAEIGPSPEGTQQRADVTVLSTGAVVAAWEDTREGCSRIEVNVAIPGGLTFGQASVRTSNLGAPRAVRLASHGALSVVLAWHEPANVGTGLRDDDVYVATSQDGGQSFMPAVRMGGAGAVGTMQARPTVTIDPVDGRVYVAWADARSGAVRVRVARSVEGRDFDEGVPVEALPTGAYDPVQDQWAPAIAANGGRVALAWEDHRTGAWTLRAVESAKGGDSWGPSFRGDDAGDDPGGVASEPSVWVDPAGGWGVAWTDLRGDNVDRDVRFARVEGGVPSASGVLPRTDGRHAPQWGASITQEARGTLVALWQDFRDGANHVYMATSADGGRSFGPDQRADDGPGASQQYAPRVAALPQVGAVALWTDDRSGAYRVRGAIVDRLTVEN